MDGSPPPLGRRPPRAALWLSSELGWLQDPEHSWWGLPAGGGARAEVLGAWLPAPRSAGGVFAAVTSSPIRPAGPAGALNPRLGAGMAATYSQSSGPRAPLPGRLSGAWSPCPSAQG